VSHNERLNSSPRTAHARRLRRERLTSYAAGALLITAGLSLGVWTLWPYVAPVRGPRLVFDETAHDFGAIDQTRQVRYVFTFVNRGTEILHVKDVVPS